MVRAEEERRKKALEERRQSQREATERCKLAMSRLKGSSKLGSTTHPRDIPVESMSKLVISFHFITASLSLPPPPVHLSKHPSTTSKPPISKQPSPHPLVGERIVLGSEVELRTNPTTERRPPSLDDVLRAIRGLYKLEDKIPVLSRL